MRTAKVLAVAIAILFLAGLNSTALQKDDATKKLGAFIGKWDTEATFASGDKATSSLDCRWSSQGGFMVCEQIVHMGGAETRQMTVYSYDPKGDSYNYTTISVPGGKPSSGAVAIKGNVWTYDFSFDANGKSTQIHNTNEFTDAKTEVFKVVSSDDGGAHWKPMLEGKAHKIAD
jgi:hypothetical protein